MTPLERAAEALRFGAEVTTNDRSMALARRAILAYLDAVIEAHPRGAAFEEHLLLVRLRDEVAG